MPRRDDIKRIMVIGSGPVVIGQAAEFDYSGVQACKVLLEEGYEVVLVNSNPATIMTDPEFATRTYVEPLLPGPVAQIIENDIRRQHRWFGARKRRPPSRTSQWNLLLDILTNGAELTQYVFPTTLVERESVAAI